MGDRKAFFYGTLMAREVLNRVTSITTATSTLTILPALLSNHTRRRVRFADYPGVIPQSGHNVRGTYVTGLTDANIRALDNFEGSEYDRRMVTVKLIGKEGEEGEEVEAETYIYVAGENRLENREWDFKEFYEEKMHRWIPSEFGETFDFEDSEAEAKKHDPTGGRSMTKISKDVEWKGVGDPEEEEDKEEVLRSAV